MLVLQPQQRPPGWWLPGLLLQHVLWGSGDAVRVDLLERADNDDVCLLDTIRVRYGAMPHAILGKVGLADDVVEAAWITVVFRPRNPNWTREHWPCWACVCSPAIARTDSAESSATTAGATPHC